MLWYYLSQRPTPNSALASRLGGQDVGHAVAGADLSSGGDRLLRFRIVEGFLKQSMKIGRLLSTDQI